MFEVLTCKRPYSDNRDLTDNPVKLYRALQKGERPGPIPDEPFEVIELIKDCWRLDPKRRPTMEKVLRKINYIRRLRYLFTIDFK